jgi:hypothetical protein
MKTIEEFTENNVKFMTKVVEDFAGLEKERQKNGHRKDFWENVRYKSQDKLKKLHT